MNREDFEKLAQAIKIVREQEAGNCQLILAEVLLREIFAHEGGVERLITRKD